MQGRGETMNGRFGKIKIRGKNKYRGAVINGTGRDPSLKKFELSLTKYDLSLAKRDVSEFNHFRINLDC
jgi:hypothetical protein